MSPNSDWHDQDEPDPARPSIRAFFRDMAVVLALIVIGGLAVLALVGPETSRVLSAVSGSI
jgi:hypothetical protein